MHSARRKSGLNDVLMAGRPGKVAGHCLWSRGPVITWMLLLLWAVIPFARSQYPAADEFYPFPNDSVYTAIVQPDGKIVIGGAFTVVGNEPSSGIGRLNADGSVDRDFLCTANSTVKALALQADGRIVVAGLFTSLDGQTCQYVGRVNPDGSRDTGMNPLPNFPVHSLAVQADGKILLAGLFTILGGQTHSRLGRLNADGSVDSGFNAAAAGAVYSLALQPDGKIVVGGGFTQLNGEPRNGIARLNSDGSLDDGFNLSANNVVYALALQADGKILAGGEFSSMGGQPRSNIARLNADGTVDGEFNPGADGKIVSVAVQADGKIVVGGAFTSIAGEPHNGIARLNADGTLDSVFGPGADNAVFGVAMQADGKILVGGAFNMLGGQTRQYLGRLNRTDPAIEDLNYQGSTLTWLRRGTSPEAWRTRFDITTNGTDWALLGEGFRIPGGWAVAAVSLPAESIVRARGFVAGGAYNASGWFVESYYGRPYFLTGPASQTCAVSNTVSLTAVVGGTEPLSCQWLKDGAPLTDGPNRRGTATPVLKLFDVLGSHAGAYSLVVSNAFGAVTSAVANVTVLDPWIIQHPSDQVGQAGQETSFTVMAVGSEPLRFQWWKDDLLLPGATGDSLALTNLQGSDAGNYRVVVSNEQGSVTSTVAALTMNLATLDDQFDPVVAGDFDPHVYSLALQRDGKILVGGWFESVGGTSQVRVARLNANGTLDSSFTPLVDDTVFALAVQPDGKILVGGGFGNLGGEARSGLARFTSDGTLDLGFHSPSSNPVDPGSVYGVSLQPDGRILVCGSFAALAGQARNSIARLNSDGTLDSGFTAGAGRDDAQSPWIKCLVLQPDGKILVGGFFTSMCGQPRTNIARLNSDGTLDSGFTAGAAGGESMVNCLAVEPDGRILIGGLFTSVCGQPRANFARLNADGTLDSGFMADADGSVDCVTLQADGTILVGGTFRRLADEARERIARISSQGIVDSEFNPVAQAVDDPWEGQSAVNALVVQPDGKILVGGQFFGLAGQERSLLARLNNTQAALETVSYSGSTMRWTREGSSAEVWRTAFEVFTNGGDWALLGEGSRVPGGWELGNLSLPADCTVRARGFLSQGFASWFLESYYGRPLYFLEQPAGLSNEADSSARFSVMAGGSEPLGYQWLKNGALLTDGTNLSGTATPVLVMTGILGADVGDYAAVVTNSFGAITSRVATLVVVDPVIAAQPSGLNGEEGQSASLSVTVRGTAPIGYQWCKDGLAVEGVITGSLTLSNLQVSDAGWYSVVLSNQYGQATSAVALVTVNMAPRDGEFDAVAGDSEVSQLAIDPEGRIVVGGDFYQLNLVERRCFGRLNSDGTLDNAFNPGLVGGWGRSLALQVDGKILIGGWFTSVRGQIRNGIARLNPDGTLDSSFNPGVGGTNLPSVHSLAVQADGKILVGGSFTTLGGHARDNLGRLNADGTVDLGFNPGASGRVYSLAVLGDGEILVGGSFTNLAGQSRSCIGLLKPDGTLDNGFDPGVQGSSAYLSTLGVQADGKILIGGRFESVGGVPHRSIARLNPDGTVDHGFDLEARGPGTSAVVSGALAVQADGRILVGGRFNSISGQPRTNLARLNTDGSLDSRFSPAADEVFGLALQSDGKIMVGGLLDNLAGEPCARIGRLNNTEPAMQELSFDGATITWLRGGTSPEVLSTSFDVSTNNGASWWTVGQGSRIAGTSAGAVAGWELTGLSLPADAVVRARGFIFEGSSSWFVESYYGKPVFNSQSGNQVMDAGNNAVFRVSLRGSEPFRYQWFKDGMPLLDGPNIGGTTTGLLVVTNVALEDSGRYWAVVSNHLGSVTSTVAVLTVNQILLDNRFGPTPQGAVYALGLEPGGSILVGGAFTGLAGQPREALGRLHKDGSLDSDFDSGAIGGRVPVQAVHLQPDGRILVVGMFTNLDGQTRKYVGRLNPDGSLDPGVNPQPNFPVSALAVQADGKILLGGAFTTLSGSPRSRLGRLNPDGTLDTGFTANAGGAVYSVAVQADGAILVAGGFTQLNSRPRGRIGRLNPDGSLDTGFSPIANNAVYALALQADGKILVGGAFSSMSGQPRTNLARLNVDGSLDGEFDPGANSNVVSIAVQADGKIVVGGAFTRLGGQTVRYVGRLYADGMVDQEFSAGANGEVAAVALQGDGKLLVGGDFSTLGGQSCNGLGRLHATEPVTHQFSYDGSTVRWLRSGSSAEFWRTTFEASSDGLDWAPLGEGIWSGYGWQLAGVSLSAETTLRARGYVSGGNGNGCGWFVQARLSGPWPIRLMMVREGSEMVLSWTGGVAPYQLQQTRNLGGLTLWNNIGPPLQTNWVKLPVEPGNLFFRIGGQ